MHLEFWIIASPLMHKSSRAINFFSDSHASRYNFGNAKEHPLSVVRPRRSSRSLVGAIFHFQPSVFTGLPYGTFRLDINERVIETAVAA